MIDHSLLSSYCIPQHAVYAYLKAIIPTPTQPIVSFSPKISDPSPRSQLSSASHSIASGVNGLFDALPPSNCTLPQSGLSCLAQPVASL
jgi:hypothetical protein